MADSVSARAELVSAAGFSYETDQIGRFIDAYRDEVLRQAAAKIRLGAKPCGSRWCLECLWGRVRGHVSVLMRAAAAIDPDVES